MDSDRQWPMSRLRLQGKSLLHGNQQDVQHKRTILRHYCYYKILFGKYYRYEQQQDQFIRCRNVQVMYIYQIHTA